jgi:hypothetical protein
MTYIRMIKCPICQSSLHFYINFYKDYSYHGYRKITWKGLKFAEYWNMYDRRCNKCDIAFKSAYFKNGGKQSIKQVIKNSKRKQNLSKVLYTSNDHYCDIKHIEDYLLLTPVKERAQDIPFESSLKVPDDFHNEFIEYKKKFKEEL